jgi:hypothetical protein
MYLHCPRCRLAIRCRVDNAIPANCRRCLTRAGIAVPVFASPLNGAELWAADGGRRTPTASPRRNAAELWAADGGRRTPVARGA